MRYNVCMALKQRTVYFREEDLPLWEALPNKAEWLHEHLNQGREGFENIYYKGKPVERDTTATSAAVNELSGLANIVDDSTESVEIGKIYRTNYDGTYKEDVTDTFGKDEPKYTDPEDFA